MKHIPWMTLLPLMTLMIAGCDSSDERLAGFAERSNAEQARQNQATSEMALQTNADAPRSGSRSIRIP